MYLLGVSRHHAADLPADPGYSRMHTTTPSPASSDRGFAVSEPPDGHRTVRRRLEEDAGSSSAAAAAVAAAGQQHRELRVEQQQQQQLGPEQQPGRELLEASPEVRRHLVRLLPMGMQRPADPAS